MQFNIYFKVKGPVKDTEVPNIVNPVDCESLSEVLKVLSEKIDTIPSMTPALTGVRVEQVKDV